MITNEMSEGFSELLLIIENINEELKRKIPVKVTSFFIKNKSKTYTPNLDFTKEIKEINLKKETRYLLELLYLNYWSTEEEKQELLSIFQENEKKQQLCAKEKYNIDNLFKKNKIKENFEKTLDKQVSLVEYKESHIKKILKKIVSFFKKLV